MSLPEARMAVGESDRTARGEAALTRRSALRLAFALAISGPVLAACSDGGFRPLYGSAGIGAAADQKLAHVQIDTIPGRVGQRIRNELIFQTTGGGTAGEPLHQLNIAIRESVTSTLVQTNGDARGQIYNLEASFRLVRTSDKKVVLEGKSFGRAGFERFDSIFSNVRAREDAENRAARTIGEDLKARLSAYLAGAA